jgi:hypothetical protein
MAITASYLVLVDGRLELRSRLVAFKYAPGSHTGKRMGELFVNVLRKLEIAHRVRLLLSG